MTPHQPTDRLLASRTRPRAAIQRAQPAQPRPMPLRLLPWLAIGTILLVGSASAQLSAVGQVTGTVGGTGQLPHLPAPDLSTSVELQKQVTLETPRIDIDGHVYTVLSAAQAAAARVDDRAYQCSQVTSQVQAPTELSSYVDVCSHFQAQALLMDAYGLVQAVQLASGQWITMPDLHQRVSLDIGAKAGADTGFIDEAKGWIGSKLHAAAQTSIHGSASAAGQLSGQVAAAGQSLVDGAKSVAGSISASFRAGIELFGGF